MPCIIEAVEIRQLLAAVTGRVFLDANADGVVSTGETVLGGAAVYVDLNNDAKRQSAEPQAVSASTGAYTISSTTLTQGKSYTLRLVPPAGYAGAASTSVYLGSSSTKAKDLGTWAYAKVTLKAYLDANKNYKMDAGEAALGSVTYWDDANDNLRQDATDPVYGPGTVTTNMKPGFHRVTPSLLTGYQYVTTTVGNFTVASGQIVTPTPFGYYYPARYGGYVYQDKNKNGKYDTGEGLAGRRVFADKNGDNHQGEGEPGALTDASGYYVVGLNPGSFTLRQVLPNGWTGSSGKSIYVAGSSYAIVNGNDLVSAPSAVATHGTISGFVFNDANGSAKQDAGEGNFTSAVSGTRGQPRVFIDLNKDGYVDNDERWMAVNTDGTFAFADVLPGTYTIGVYGYHSTWITTVAGKGVTVAAGQTASLNFGARAYTQVNVQTFLDANGNGVADGTDLGNAVPAVVYADANNNGRLDAGEVSTNDNNQPWLTGLRLPAGTYKIRQVVPSGLSETGHGGYNLSAASTFAADYTLRLPADNPYDSGEMTLYFASGGKPAVTGTVFEDRNGNGLLDAATEWGTGEFGFVYADANANRKYDTGEDQATLNYDGTFKMYPKAGRYTIRMSLWGGLQQTVATNTAVVVAAGVVPPPVTFGVRVWSDDRIPTFTVKGTVFNDKNRNGKIDAGEGGSAYAGWHVYVDLDGTGDYDDNNAYMSAVVAADGTYSVRINADGTPFRLLLQNKTGQAYSTAASYTVSSAAGGATLTGKNFGLS